MTSSPSAPVNVNRTLVISRRWAPVTMPSRSSGACPASIRGKVLAVSLSASSRSQDDRPGVAFDDSPAPKRRPAHDRRLLHLGCATTPGYVARPRSSLCASGRHRTRSTDPGTAEVGHPIRNAPAGIRAGPAAPGTLL